GPRDWRWYRNGGHVGARSSRTKPTRSKSGGALCRSHRRTGRERQQAARKRTRQGGERTSTPRDGPVGLALCDLPERQCISPVVSDTNCKRWQKTQNNDRGPGTQVTNCLMAPGDHWRGSSRRRIASGVREEIGQDKLGADEAEIVGIRSRSEVAVTRSRPWG